MNHSLSGVSPDACELSSTSIMSRVFIEQRKAASAARESGVKAAPEGRTRLTLVHCVAEAVRTRQAGHHDLRSVALCRTLRAVAPTGAVSLRAGARRRSQP